MNQNESRTEHEAPRIEPAAKRPWITPTVTVDKVSQVTRSGFFGVTNDGSSFCSS